MAAFSLRGLTKVYGEGLTAVRALGHVVLEVSEGELVVLLGPSESGKALIGRLREKSVFATSR